MLDLRAMQTDAAKQLLARPVAQEIIRGKITRLEYVNYMCDVYCYALHSSQVIGLAAVRLTLSHPPMARYLFKHAEEEMGHDQWAKNDLLDLGVTETEIARSRPSSPCHRMLGLEYLYAAHLNPVGLFGWMFVLESLGGRVGGGLATAIDKTLKLNGKGMYFLKGHAEADAHHSEDLYRVIEENIATEVDRDAFLGMYRESLDLYCELLDHTRLPERRAA